MIKMCLFLICWEMWMGWWARRHPLFQWKEDLIAECDVFFGVEITIKWTYQRLVEDLDLNDSPLYDVFCKKLISSKVSLFVLAIPFDKLSMKDNLLKYCVVNLKYQLCSGGRDFEETSQHLFIDCLMYGIFWVWWLIFWILVVMPNNLVGHVHAFFEKKRRIHYQLQIVWMYSFDLYEKLKILKYFF